MTRILFSSILSFILFSRVLSFILFSRILSFISGPLFPNRKMIVSRSVRNGIRQYPLISSVTVSNSLSNSTRIAGTIHASAQVTGIPRLYK